MLGSDLQQSVASGDSCDRANGVAVCPSQLQAFTLVELLVVISIIALLMAILLPSLLGARRQARSAQCLARESQLGVAMQIYANDFNDSVPQVYGGSVEWSMQRGAMYQLVVASGVVSSSENHPEILVCPESRPKGALSYALNGVLFGFIPDSSDKSNHAQSNNLGSPYDDGPTTEPLHVVPSVKISTVRSPSSVVAMYDVDIDSLAAVWKRPLGTSEADLSDQFTGTGRTGMARPNPGGFMWQKSNDDPPIVTKTLHGRAYNVLFVDSHASTHSSWDESKMTRLTGVQPNDTSLY